MVRLAAAFFAFGLVFIPALAGATPPAAQEKPTQEYPALMFATHVVLGPHAPGEEDCQVVTNSNICDHTGRFLGTGGSVELRGRLWRFIYAHTRFEATGNVLHHDAGYGGLLRPGVGLGIYSRLAFLRGEFMAGWPLGDGEYRGAGGQERVRERWSPFAGSISGGGRIALAPRVMGEFLLGAVVGPQFEARRIPENNDPQKGIVVTFILGLGVSFDLVR